MKKNLIIILIMPFLIALIGIVSLNLTFRNNYSDLVSLDWDLKSLEALSVEESELDVTATPIAQANKILAPGNDKLKYTLINKNGESEVLANLVVNGNYVTPDEDGSSSVIVSSSTHVYVKPKLKGEIIIRVENEKGNVYTFTEIILYKSSVIVFNPVVPHSQNNIDSLLYYGIYDYTDGLVKKEAEVDFELRVIPASLLDEILVETSDNLKIEINKEDYEDDGAFRVVNFKMKPKSAGEGYFNFTTDETYQSEDDKTDNRRMDFMLVDGINIYNYQELLEATNRSNDGEVICLRKNFLDLETYLQRGNLNDELFGVYNEKTKKVESFKNDVYRFETTYNQEYIKFWNTYQLTNSSFKEVSNKLACALHIQKSVYGNGYSLNFHNLTYPSARTDKDGVSIPTLAANDIFRGPLPFYCMGDPNGVRFVMVYGQDNSGLYIDGDNIVIDDLNVSNCNTPDALEFYDYVGNVVDIYGDNVSLLNSRFQNGKNVVRVFSSQNLLVDNCMLSNSQNFLFVTGSNEYEKVNDINLAKFSKGGLYDNQLNEYLQGSFESKDKMKNQLEEIQKVLNEETAVNANYKGSAIINDTFFYKSGLACICFESLFNGPFLYSGAPSLIGDLFDHFEAIKQMIPVLPTGISGISYPVTITLTGDNRFYDYKKIDDIDLSSLIEENFSGLVAETQYANMNITVDTIFPLKETLIQMANRNNCIYRDETNNNQEYISIPICYYGGGVNLSKVLTQPQQFTRETSTMRVDFASKFLNMEKSIIDLNASSGQAMLSGLSRVALKCVVVATGFEPFRFTIGLNNGNLFGLAPQINDLKSHLEQR